MMNRLFNALLNRRLDNFVHSPIKRFNFWCNIVRCCFDMTTSLSSLSLRSEQNTRAKCFNETPRISFGIGRTCGHKLNKTRLAIAYAPTTKLALVTASTAGTSGLIPVAITITQTFSITMAFHSASHFDVSHSVFNDVNRSNKLQQR
jgi:hypothetical protein